MREKYFSVHGFKRIRKKRQEDFAVNEDYADRLKMSLSRGIFDQNQQKIPILNHLCRHNGMGKKNHLTLLSL
jgi:hypothetical protein